MTLLIWEVKHCQKISKCTVSAFFKVGVPLAKIDHFRELLEEHTYRLTEQRNINDYVP